MDAGVDRPGHQRHAARLRRIAVLRHDGGRDQRGDAGLADRDDVRARPQHFEKFDQMADVVVESERAVLDRNVAHVVPVGDVDVVLRQHRAHGRAQQRREVAGQRRDQQDARLRLLDVLLEVQQGAERRDMRRLLGDRDLPVADRHPVDPERRALVGEPRARDQLIGRREIAQRRRADRTGKEPAAKPPGGAGGKRADRSHDVAMCLICLIKHPLPAARSARSIPSRTEASAFLCCAARYFSGRLGR